MNVLVTGATGFVGRHAVETLLAQGHGVVMCVRREPLDAPRGTTCAVVPDIAAYTKWDTVLPGIDCILHVAGRAHVNPVGNASLEDEFREVNIRATERLAAAAVASGVRRFVFVSSIGVNGSSTHGKAFTPADSPAPNDFYAHTKYEAEERLKQILEPAGVEWVVVRPTLVAGAGAPGNLSQLARFVRRGIPLPVGAIRHNRRSLIGVRSLASLLALSCTHRDASARTLLAADDPALSTLAIVLAIAEGMAIKPRIARVPCSMLRVLATLARRGRDAERLCGSLEVDASLSRATLGWRTEHSIHDELRALGRFARLEGQSA